MLRIKKVLPYVIAFLIAIGLPLAVWKTMPREKKHIIVNFISGTKENVVEATSIEQSFRAVDNKLSSIAVYIAPVSKSNSCVINVKLMSKNSELYMDKDINIVEANPRPLLKLDFPEIEDSNNKEFILTISNSNSSKGNRVLLYTNDIKKYDDGVLKKNGIIQEVDLSLNTYYSKTKKELISMMLNELPVKSTAFWSICTFFLIVLFLFIKESLKILE